MAMTVIISTGFFLVYVLFNKNMDPSNPDFNNPIMLIPALALFGLYGLVFVKFGTVLITHPYIIIRNQFYPHPIEFQFSYTWLVMYSIEVTAMIPLIGLFAAKMEMDNIGGDVKGKLTYKDADEDSVKWLDIEFLLPVISQLR
jgi:hypothetical protein